MNFALLAHAMKPETNALFKEYKAFADHPMIGNFCGSRDDGLRVLAAHEFAHWLQRSPRIKRPPGDYRKPHGAGFQKTYWLLRHHLGLRSQSPAMEVAP
jgi:hypothetical protein